MVPTRRLVGPLALTWLLLATLIAVFPVADAQVISIRGQYEPRGFGWTFPEGEFAGAEATDATGDVGVRAASQDVAPPAAHPLLPSLDLRSLRIDEVDAEILRFRIGYTDLDPLMVEASGGSLFALETELRFSIGGRDFLVSGNIFLACEEGDAACDGTTSREPLFFGDLWEVTDGQYRILGEPPSRILVEQDVMEILVPRWSLDRSGLPLHPIAGDTLDGVSVVMQYLQFMSINGESSLTFLDRLPDDGVLDGFHTLVTDSYGSHVKLSRSDAAAKRAEVTDDVFFTPSKPIRPRTVVHDAAPGEPVLLPIWVQNTLDRKALATGSYSVLSDHEGVTIEGPDHFDVPGGGSRKLQLTITTPSTYSADAPLRIALDIATVGTPTPYVDRLEVHIRHVPLLSAEAPRLYLHRYGEMDALSENGVWSFNFKEGVLNTLEDDPADVPVGASMQFCCFVDGTYDWDMASGLSRDVHLDPEQKGTFHLAYEAAVPGSLNLELFVDYDDTLVAMGDAQIDIEAGVGSVDIPLTIMEDASSLPPSERGFHLFLAPNFSPGRAVPLGQLAALADPLPPKLLTQGATWIELPVLASAPKVIDARHLVVDLANDPDPLRYVNPGKTALWTLSVLNQGTQDDTVTIKAATDRPGWKASVTPGDRYTLGPGDSITVGIRVTAPEGAAEAETVKVNVTAASKRLDGATSGLQLTAIATAGETLEEDTYEADNETVRRLSMRDKERDAPAVGLLPLIGLMLVFGHIARRRQKR